MGNLHLKATRQKYLPFLQKLLTLSAEHTHFQFWTEPAGPRVGVKSKTLVVR